MAEEDLIFGKNRHMFGGIEPSNMLKFTVTRDVAKNQIKIIAQLPDDTMIGDQLLCTVGGAVIRRKTTGYPVDEFDGDFVAKLIKPESYDYFPVKTIVDSGADPNTVYYYAAFPFSTQDVYNRGHKNRAKYDYPSATYYFGFDLDTTDSNPATRVTYPSEVMNASYTAAKMDFTAEMFNYGGWPSTPGDKFMPTPCVVTKYSDLSTIKPGQTVIRFDLDPNDYSKKADGTAVDLSGSTKFNEYMMRWPKIYVHREVVNGIYKFRCADVKLGEDWNCICNYDPNGNEIDNFFTGIYSVDGRGKLPATWTKSSYSDLLQSLHNNIDRGMEWDYDVLADRLLIQDLLIMMAKTTDYRKAYGRGNCTSGERLVNGTMDTKGLFYGSSGGRDGVKVFGMENYWGNYYRILTGFLIDSGKIKVKYTSSGGIDGTYVNGYNATGRGYLEIADMEDIWPSTTSVSAYMSEMFINSYGRIPKEGLGSSTTYETDKFQYDKLTDGVVFARTAGTTSTYGRNADVGLFSIYATVSVNSTNPAACGYYSYKPKKGSLG